MQALAGEIQIVIAITLLLLLLTSFVVVFVSIQQQQYHKHLQEKEDIKNQYEQEILKAQLEMKEQTLHMISQEIHDNIGQILALVKLNLNTVVPEAGSPMGEKITDTKELVGKAIRDLRNLSKTLNTEHVSHQLLSQSLQFELDLIRKTELCTTYLQVNGLEEPFDPQKQLIVFRIAQEVFHNSMKHARAKSISVKLDYSLESVTLRIEDDGVGFDSSVTYHPGAPDQGLGISNMVHRAKIIGANLLIDSHPGRGTLTQLSLATHP